MAEETYEDGLIDGEEIGYDKGFDAGYDKAKAEAKTFFEDKLRDLTWDVEKF
ncbi:MAG: hypothetical protein ACYDHZ_00585 [Dehalococcoidia bacterium]